jgi:hypothetical protein
METVEIFLPDKVKFLLTEKSRYKVLYGGRGAERTFNMVSAMIFLLMHKPMKVLYPAVKEISFVWDIIVHNNLERYFEKKHYTIKVFNGGQIIFEKDYNKFKTYDSFNLTLLTDGLRVSEQAFLETCIVTRRKESELWIDLEAEWLTKTI